MMMSIIYVDTFYINYKYNSNYYYYYIGEESSANREERALAAWSYYKAKGNNKIK